MKAIWTAAIAFFSFSAHAQEQDKYGHVYYNKLTEVKGSDYMIASVENRSKIGTHSQYLLFINAKTGATKQVDFPKDASINKIEQLKFDTLNFNKILVTARTVNLDDSKSIDWGDPAQIFILSTDGTGKTQITDDNYYVSSWLVNRQFGTIVVTGHYDTNGNGKYDRQDKGTILVYDLVKMKLIEKINT